MSVGPGKPAFSRYSVASLLATGLSQLVLFALYAWGGVEALSASVIAFAVGTVPHFVLVRWWAWGQRGVPRLTGQLVGYLVTTVVGGVVSVVLTTGVDLLVEPLLADRGTRTLVLNITYVLGGLPVFLAKYAVLDRVFGSARDDAGQPVGAYEATSSTSVRAANPVAPGTTSS